MLTSDVISLHIQREMRKNLIGDLIVSFHEKKVKFKDVVIEENEISIKHQNLSNLNFDAYLNFEPMNTLAHHMNSKLNIFEKFERSIKKRLSTKHQILNVEKNSFSYNLVWKNILEKRFDKTRQSKT